MEQFDVLVIGGGAAGMAAALAAAERGRRVLLVERERALGGILNQCLHRGFGLSWYGEDLSGVEYAARFVRTSENAPVTVQTGAEVLEIRTDKTALISARNALFRVAFDQCVLAAGCREKPLGALDVAGTRPAGIFTAGTAQKLVNVGHYSVGKDVVILGSGDVGQIMARQLCQSGRRVAAMVEQASELGGLARNRRDCVEAYQIPVLLRTTVEAVLGAERVTDVRLRDLDTGEAWDLPCDTLITAVGLVPDRTLLPAGDIPPWLHLAGNCDYVHDIVDAVTREALALGEKL
jgi:NADPH-dependent 2,4-dienoyl-CoA reductase/sulfur reductase-like enzyme